MNRRTLVPGLALTAVAIAASAAHAAPPPPGYTSQPPGSAPPAPTLTPPVDTSRPAPDIYAPPGAAVIPTGTLPPPPPPAQPPSGATPAPAGTAPSAELITRTATLKRRKLKLVFRCAPGFSAELRFPGRTIRRRFAACRAETVTVSVRLSRATVRRIRARGIRKITVIVRDGGKLATRTVRLRRPLARAAGWWAPADAYYDCYPSYTGGITGGGANATETDLVRNWHSSDGGVHWIYEKLVLEEYLNGRSYWLYPGNTLGAVVEFNDVAQVPNIGPYRMAPNGVLDWQRTDWDPFSQSYLTTITPALWPVSWLKGYDAYIRAWAALWVWYPATGWWFTGWHNAPVKDGASNAPGWCWQP